MHVIKPEIALLSPALIESESNPFFLLHLSGLFRDAGQGEFALEACRKGLIVDPQHYGLLIFAGDLYIAQGDYDLALDHFQVASQIEEPTTELLHKMGSCQVQLGQKEKAELTFLLALSRRPHFLQANGSLGDLYTKQERYGEAISQFQRIVDIFPDNTSVWLRLSQLHRAQNNADAALVATNRLIELDGDNTKSWLEYFEVGKVYQSKGNATRARFIFLRVAERLPENIQVRTQLRSLDRAN